MWDCCSADDFAIDTKMQHHDFAHYSQDHMPCFQPPTFLNGKLSEGCELSQNYDVARTMDEADHHHNHHNSHSHHSHNAHGHHHHHPHHHHHHHHHHHREDHQEHIHEVLEPHKVLDCHEVIDNHNNHSHTHHDGCNFFYDESQLNHVPDVTHTKLPCQFSWSNGPCPPQCEDRLPEMNEPDKKKILQEIHEECEHLLAKDDCASCHIKFGDNTEDIKAIPFSKLVDIVLMTAGASLDDVSRAASALCRKREQNKEAASKYRDRQKNKWRQLNDEKEELEERNEELKKAVAMLEKEVAMFRQKLLSQ